MSSSEDPASCAGFVHPLIWAATTVATAVVVYWVIAPEHCNEVDECRQLQQQASFTINGCVSCGLLSLFLHEAGALYLHHQSAQPLHGLIAGLREFFIPSLLLCITFSVLLVENLFLMSPLSPILIHSAAGKPLYTAIYSEWLINVPLLLVLAGKCGLGLPLSRLTSAVVLTNVYIILAWAAFFIADATRRWTVVAVSFTLYGWASFEMMRWVKEYRVSASPEAPSRTLKQCLTVGLIAIFGIYGIVYLCALVELISSDKQRISFICMDASSKLLMSLAFAGIRSSGYHDMLVDMLVNTSHPFRRQVAYGTRWDYVTGGPGDPLLVGTEGADGMVNDKHPF